MIRVLKIFILSGLLVLPFAVVSQHAKGPYPNLCPHSATLSYDGKGLIPFYKQSSTRLNAFGKTGQEAINSIAGDRKEFAFIKVRNEDVPMMDNKGHLHYDKPYDANLLLYYKGPGDIRKTWWFHQYNDPKNEIITYGSGLVDTYKEKKNFKIHTKDEIDFDLASKDFVFAEYSVPEGMMPTNSDKLVNKLDYCFTHTLFQKTGTVPDSEQKHIVAAMNDFLKKFENSENIQITNRAFVTTIQGSVLKFIAVFNIYNGKLVGEVYRVNDQSKPLVLQWMKASLAKLMPEGALYVYGDNLFDMGRKIADAASALDVVVISRNTKISKSFEETEETIAKLWTQTISKDNLKFINGTPSTVDEAAFQSMDNGVELLKDLKTKIDEKAIGANTAVITTKEELIKEITEGSSDFLMIVAHCDETSMYFNSSKISLDELNALQVRSGRSTPRTAILFSCLTGNLFEKKKPLLTWFRKQTQSFSEVLIEKNFFDYVIAPSATINGDQILRMLDELDKHPILVLRKYLDQSLVSAQVFGIGKN